MSELSKGKARDPGLKKARDNARQRKIASNRSDKASRKNAPRIKAMANRQIRHKDKADLRHPEDIEESADQINLAHKQKYRHWGSDNAAEMRAARADTLRYFESVGGRNAAQSIAWDAYKEKVARKLKLHAASQKSDKDT